MGIPGHHEHFSRRHNGLAVMHPARNDLSLEYSCFPVCASSACSTRLRNGRRAESLTSSAARRLAQRDQTDRVPPPVRPCRGCRGRTCRRCASASPSARRRRCRCGACPRRATATARARRIWRPRTARPACATRDLGGVLSCFDHVDDAVGDRRRIRHMHVARDPHRRRPKLAAVVGHLERHDAAVGGVAVAVLECGRRFGRRAPHRAHIKIAGLADLRRSRSRPTRRGRRTLLPRCQAAGPGTAASRDWCRRASWRRAGTARLLWRCSPRACRPLKAKTTGFGRSQIEISGLRCAQFAGVNESMILNSLGASASTASPKLPTAGSDAPSAVWIRIPLGPFTTPPRPQAPAGLPLFGVQPRQARMHRIADIHRGDIRNRVGAPSGRGRIDHVVDEVEAPVSRKRRHEIGRRQAACAVGQAQAAQLAVTRREINDPLLLVDDRGRVLRVGTEPGGGARRRERVRKLLSARPVCRCPHPSRTRRHPC